MVRASVAIGIDIQQVLQLIDEPCRDKVFGIYAEQNQEISRVPPVVLHNKARRDWEFRSSEGVAWRKLKQYLIDFRGRTESEVDSLDQATDRILEQLADPNEFGEDLPPVKGLVIGYVQSGKTANYTALSAKAFDAGYKVVIVLSGIHRSLRRQTQIRMNDELGIANNFGQRITSRNFGPDTIEPITSMTSEDLEFGDSQYSGVSRSVIQGKVLFVVKKNTAVLERLILWLGEQQKVEVPCLIIDDESDQASINTGGNRGEISDSPDLSNPDEPEEPPAVINSKVRRLVNLFANVSYVGYTATPYANVFIDHQAVDRAAGEDLYPKDFIVSLSKPAGYFGPEELFEEVISDGEDGDLSLSSKVIEIVPASEVQELNDLLEDPIFPDSRMVELPASLVSAIKNFILATAVLCTIKGRNIATAFLVHTTPSKIAQNILSELIEKYIRFLQREWRYDQEVSRPMWELEWEKFSVGFGASSPYSLTFEEIFEELDRLLVRFGEINILTLNSDSPDELDYQYQPYGASVVIGGNKLSRGLTIEGLLVSYFTRKASDPKADTLTQMGRFFGHRKPIVDISRIYTTQELNKAFQEIALVEAALRNDIRRYEREGLRPIDFGPRVLKRASLMPTARNRMGVAAQHGRTYSGELVQTSSFPDGRATVERNGMNVNRLQKNYLVTSEFITKLAEISAPSLGQNSSTMIWQDVNSGEVLNFLGQYAGVEDATRFVPAHLCAYIRDLNESALSPELSSWTVAVIGREPTSAMGSESFGSNFSVGRINRAIDKDSPNSIGTLVTPLSIRKSMNGISIRGDELADLERASLELLYEEGMDLAEFRSLVRSSRPNDRGLLMIYPISPDSFGSSEGKKTEPIGNLLGIEANPCTVVGVALVFPNSDVELKPYWQGSAGNRSE
jgi:hypothetical protein